MRYRRWRSSVRRSRSAANTTMLGMNRVTLLGHAGRNPEMRKLPSGDDVAQFSLATTERFRRKDVDRRPSLT